MASRRNEPAAPLPASERKALSAGIAFALACAAALSAPTLFELARLIGFHAALAWLLPAALDGYAGTSIWIGRRITRSHPAARAARRNARTALALTIVCNGLYHLLVLAGNSVPRGLHIGLLVAVSSLPPFIVDRLLHLNTIANGSAEAPADRPASSVQPPRRATVQPSTDRPTPAASTPAPTVQEAVHPAPAPSVHPRPRTATPDRPLDGAASVQPSRQRWAEVGRTVYEQIAQPGKRPAEKAFQEALAAHAHRLIAAGELPESYANPSLSTAKRVRTDVEEKLTDEAATHRSPQPAGEPS